MTTAALCSATVGRRPSGEFLRETIAHHVVKGGSIVSSPTHTDVWLANASAANAY